MKMYQKILLIFVLILLCFSLKVKAFENDVALPKIYEDSMDIEEDPMYLRYQNTGVMRKARAVQNGDSIKSIINQYETGSAAVRNWCF